ncbi:hypothetical protein SK128_005403 [Halocaridina rubra]|uniref:Methyltransferase domain-containing protein n=1 Tax=Halocaridina rubra TaxID=373956 RepID=A0AAN8XLX4_HALRR
MLLTKQNAYYLVFFLSGVVVGILSYHTTYIQIPAEVETKTVYKAPKPIEQNQQVVTVPMQERRVPSKQEDWSKVSCPLEPLDADQWNLYLHLTTISIRCTFKASFGGSFHKVYFYGEKWICLDRRLDMKPNNCTMLSFGIGADWTFDDEIDKLFGCKVYAFDPTIGKPNHNRSDNIMFFNLGIGAPRKNGRGTVDSYQNILKLLKLENSVIDYLKIDVEGAEYPFFEDVLNTTPNLLKNVKQIGMEIHLSGNAERAWKYVQKLDCLGFKIMSYNFNPVYAVPVYKGRQIQDLLEIVWIRNDNWR